MIEKFNNVPADPSKSSVIEETLDIVRAGKEPRSYIGMIEGVERHTEIYIDRNTGEKYHKIEKKPEVQKLVSLLCKGIINTSDIVEYNGMYFSHEQNSNSINEKSEKLMEEVTADLFILKYVFNDNDHWYYSKENAGTKQDYKKKFGTIKGNDFLQHNNVLIDEKNNKLNYFDFDLSLGYIQPTNPTEIKYTFKHFLGESGPGFQKNNKGTFYEYPSKNRLEVLKILQIKTRRFLNEIFNKDNFHTFEAIFEKSKIKENFSEGLSLTKQGTFEHLAERFRILEEVIDEELKK